MPGTTDTFASSPGDWLVGRMTALCRAAADDLRRIPDSPSEGIHALRVRMKELRAMLRLTRGSLPGSKRRRLSRRARDIKNAFASNRDADVMRALAATMRRRHDLPPPVLAPVAVAAPDRPPFAPPDDPLPAVRRQLAALRRDLAALPLQSASPADLIDCYARCVRSCRRTMKRCAEDPSPERLHQWRKHVKDWTYLSMALDFLPHARANIEPSRKLASALGKIHDLAVLDAHVTGPSAPDWQRAISKSTRRRVRRILEDAKGPLSLSHRDRRRLLEAELAPLSGRFPANTPVKN